MVSHDHRDAFKLADQIMLMDDGQIVDSGTPQEIRKSGVEFTRSFIELE